METIGCGTTRLSAEQEPCLALRYGSRSTARDFVVSVVDVRKPNVVFHVRQRVPSLQATLAVTSGSALEVTPTRGGLTASATTEQTAVGAPHKREQGITPSGTGETTCRGTAIGERFLSSLSRFDWNDGATLRPRRAGRVGQKRCETDKNKAK